MWWRFGHADIMLLSCGCLECLECLDWWAGHDAPQRLDVAGALVRHVDGPRRGGAADDAHIPQVTAQCGLGAVHTLSRQKLDQLLLGGHAVLVDEALDGASAFGTGGGHGSAYTLSCMVMQLLCTLFSPRP